MGGERRAEKVARNRLGRTAVGARRAVKDDRGRARARSENSRGRFGDGGGDDDDDDADVGGSVEVNIEENPLTGRAANLSARGASL